MEKKKRGKPRKPRYRVNLTIQGDTREYKAEGATLRESLEALPTPTFFKAKGWLKVTHDKRTGELWFMPNKLRHLLRPVMRRYTAMRLEKVMK